MTIETDIITLVENIYSSLGVGEELTARQKGQRIRRARERFEQEHPKRIKFIGQIFERTEAGLMDRDGVPAGAEIQDEDEYEYEEEKSIDTQIKIEYSTKTIGGDQSGGGKTKFRLWLENVWLPKNPGVRAEIEGLDTNKRRKAMKRLSFVVRRGIAQNGLTPKGLARIENDKVRYIQYNSGNRWENPTWE
jgi:hypothetical protein